jgi:riboflavin kinase/FMN adenylyltransferase
MQHFRSLDDVHLSDVWLTIGSFDGVHLGHQSLINDLIAGAKLTGLPAVVITFFPHPSAILRGRNLPYYLCTPDEKIEELNNLGIDIVITHPFNRRVANTSAKQFILEINKHMNIRHLQIGYDFAMGRNRGGDFEILQQIGDESGFTVEKSHPVEDSGGVISSSRIRFLLGVGQVNQAAFLLGRRYSISGIIEMGDQRGKGLGYPTANLAVWSEKVIPSAGVYACWASNREKNWKAVTNIGVRPTFEKTPVPPRVEAHLLDFDQDIYGEHLKLEFVDRIRNEQRFSTIDDLVNQIRKDSETARKILSA